MVKNTTDFCFHSQIAVNSENVQLNSFLTYVFILADHGEPWLFSLSLAHENCHLFLFVYTQGCNHKPP